MADTVALASDSAAGAASHSDVGLLSAVPPRVLAYVALALVVGAAGWRLWVVPRAALAFADGRDPTPRARAAVARTGALGAAAGLLAAAWTLAAQLRSLDEGAGMLTVVVGQTHWGRAWLAQTLAFAGAAAAYAVAARAERAWRAGAPPVLTPWIAAAVAGVGAAGLQGALGHAAATGGASLAAVLLAGVHVVAGAAWIGTLAVLALAWRLTASEGTTDEPDVRPLTSAATMAPQVAAFHPVALVAATTTVLAGAGNAWLRLSGAPGAEAAGAAGAAARVAALSGTAYGRLLLVKLAFVGLVAAFGAVNARGARARRAAARRGDAPPGLDAAALARTARLELAAAVAVFVVTAALAVSTPPGAE